MRFTPEPLRYRRYRHSWTCTCVKCLYDEAAWTRLTFPSQTMRHAPVIVVIGATVGWVLLAAALILPAVVVAFAWFLLLPFDRSDDA